MKPRSKANKRGYRRSLFVGNQDIHAYEFQDTTSTDLQVQSIFKKAIGLKINGDLKKAISCYKQILALEPSNTESMMNLGVCFLESNNFKEALSVLEGATPSSKVLFNKSIALYCKKDFKSAISTLQKVENSDTKNNLLNLCCFKRKLSGDSILSRDKNPRRMSIGIKDYDTRNLRTTSISIPKNTGSIVNTPKKPFKVSLRQPLPVQRIQKKKTLEYMGRASNEMYISNRSSEDCTETDLVQKELSEIQNKKNILKDTDAVFHLQRKLASFKNTVTKDEHIREISVKDIDSKNLTIKEITFLQDQFLSFPTELRNYKKIDEILVKLRFFSKFPAIVRTSFAKAASLDHYTPGQVIFSEGDIGDEMYVIIKGSVSVEKLVPDYGSTPVIIATLYDGAQFGELSLGSTPSISKERNASCIVAESSVLMSMPKIQYQNILMRELHHDIEEKIRFFTDLVFFKDFDANQVIPLASNLESVNYYLNDVILKKGEVPKGMYIIYTGNAIACTERFAVKKLNKNRNKSIENCQTVRAKHCRHKVKRNNWVEADPLVRIRQHGLQEISQEELRKLKRSVSAVERSDEYVVKERVEFATLKEKDFFGFKVLLNDPQPAKFSIIVQSATAKVFLITNLHLNYLNNHVAAQMKRVLEKSFPVDCPDDIDPDLMEKMMLSWQHLRTNLIQEIHERKYQERHKNEYPFERY